MSSDNTPEGARLDPPVTAHHKIGRLLEAPCLWCNYNGDGYWMTGTHSAACPWHSVGGTRPRGLALPGMLAGIIRRSAAPHCPRWRDASHTPEPGESVIVATDDGSATTYYNDWSPDHDDWLRSLWCDLGCRWMRVEPIPESAESGQL